MSETHLLYTLHWIFATNIELENLESERFYQIWVDRFFHEMEVA